MKFNDKSTSVFVGEKISVEIFGASHGEEIGVKINGISGEEITFIETQDLLNRRKPNGGVYSTKRHEPDQMIITNGFENGKIFDDFRAVIKNQAQKSSDYEKTVRIPRPSHADFVAWQKYGDGYDYRGGGKFSGRLTAPMCIAGGICKELLAKKGVKVNAFISQIGSVKGKTYFDIDQEKFDFTDIDKFFPVIDSADKDKMLSEIDNARMDLDSVGGVIDCVITGVPVGTGEYMFDSIEGLISRLAFAVPAVKGIEFGKGFELSSMRGSNANDALYYDADKVKTKTNNNGGINGGISNGMPITFRVAIKPTPSISKEQDSVNLETKQNVKLKIEGRHDACIVPRAVPVIEAIASMAIYDLI